MVRVVKGNSELRIPDSEVTAYLRQGYAVVDASGSIVDVGKQLTYDELVTQYKQNTEQSAVRKQKLRNLKQRFPVCTQSLPRKPQKLPPTA